MCEGQAVRFNIAYFRYFMTFGSDFNEMSTEKVLFWSDHFTVFPKQQKHKFVDGETNETG